MLPAEMVRNSQKLYAETLHVINIFQKIQDIYEENENEYIRADYPRTRHLQGSCKPFTVDHRMGYHIA